MMILGGNALCISQELHPLSFEELEVQQSLEPRYTLVFLYTDWCKFCAAMKNTSFKDESVVELLNKRFYFVPFDGEGKDEVVFMGRNFKYNPTGTKTGVHQIAEQLGTIDGQLAYPATVLLDPQFQIVFRHNAYLDAEQLLEILRAVPD